MTKRVAADEPTKGEPTLRGPTPSKVFQILMWTMVDTTWRLFVPSVGGTALGLWADNSWNTKPWLTITGVVVGSLLSFVLIYAQLKQIKVSKEK